MKIEPSHISCLPTLYSRGSVRFTSLKFIWFCGRHQISRFSKNYRGEYREFIEVRQDLLLQDH